MEMVERPDGKKDLVSTGKLLEVIPLIEDAFGSMMMLPPAVWPVAGWILGYHDSRHIIGTPWTFWSPERIYLPNSGPNGHRMSFLIRVLEDGEAPPRAGTIDKEAAAEIITAFRTANALRAPTG